MSEQHRTGALIPHRPPDDLGVSWHRARDRSRRIEFAVVLAREDPALARSVAAWLEAGRLAVRVAGPVVWARGNLAAVEARLQVEFETGRHEARALYRLTRAPRWPESWAPAIAGVVGLDNVARARPHHRWGRVGLGGYGPATIAAAYRFPAQWRGGGICLGLAEFSSGYNPEDLAAMWRYWRISPPRVDFISVDGTPNSLGRSPDDLEATLDIEWAGAMAPGARLVVYEADAGSDDNGFAVSLLRTMQAAMAGDGPRPQILSISYGDAETRFAPMALYALEAMATAAARHGLTIFVASGDQGAYGLRGPGLPIPHVDAPANLPSVVAVGGTRLVADADGRIREETGWTDRGGNGASGGGISQVFALPAYQSGLVLPLKPGMVLGRGVPDVALNADPETGYMIWFQGQPGVVGGTSAAAPVWAALWARGLEARRPRAASGGTPHACLYGLGGSPAFHDIVVGNNNYDGVAGYRCTPGWDAVTGWGSVDGTELLRHCPA